jgi:hypothetical protein
MDDENENSPDPMDGSPGSDADQDQFEPADEAASQMDEDIQDEQKEENGGNDEQQPGEDQPEVQPLETSAQEGTQPRWTQRRI